MCQHLEDLRNLLNKYFPNSQCIILQNHSWVKDPFRMQDRLKDFNLLDEDDEKFTWPRLV